MFISRVEFISFTKVSYFFLCGQDLANDFSWVHRVLERGAEETSLANFAVVEKGNFVPGLEVRQSTAGDGRLVQNSRLT